MKEIYIVTEGRYSDDYRIVSFFSTKEKAQQLIDDIKSLDLDYAEYSIETYKLDDYEPLNGRKAYEVILNFDDGNGEAKESDSIYQLKNVGQTKKQYTKNWHSSHVKPWMGDYVFITYCLANDSNHALKIAGERLAMEKGTNRL